MFQTLEALVRSAGKLTLSLRMDGERMVVVVMPQGEGKEAALRQPLILGGTPDELDGGFVQAIQTYAGAHRSLDEQVAATTAILQAAERSQAGKAQKALQKPASTKAAATKAGASGEGEDEDTDDNHEAEDTGSNAQSGAQPVSEPATSKPAGTDLSQLLF